MIAAARHYDIAVVGGGMVGIAQALLLANSRGSWRIALIESQSIKTGDNAVVDGPAARTTPVARVNNSFDSRSTALAEGSKKILQDCGVWPGLQGQLTAIRQVHVSDRGHFGGSLLKAEDYQQDALGYVVENSYFGRALARALSERPNIEILAPAQVKQLTPQATGWSASVELGQIPTPVTCSLLILADGTASKLGKSIGIDYSVDSYGQGAVIANVETDRPHGGKAYERFTDQGPIALLPLGVSDSSCRNALVWTQPLDQVEQLMSLSDRDFCQQLQRDFGARAGHFVRVSQRHCYPLQLVVAKEQVRRGLVMMGNAAHFLHPVAGQGFNLALRDCQALAAVLAESGDDPGELPLLQRYLHAQSLDQCATIGLSHGLVKLFSSAALPSALLRGLGLLGMDVFPPGKRLFAQQAMGYPVVGYRSLGARGEHQ